MGSRGASASSGNRKLEQFISDVNYLDRGDLQGEIEAYVMSKYNTRDQKEVMAQSDKILKKVDETTKFIQDMGDETRFDDAKFESKEVQDKIKNYAKKNKISYGFLKGEIYKERDNIPF